MAAATWISPQPVLQAPGVKNQAWTDEVGKSTGLHTSRNPTARGDDKCYKLVPITSLDQTVLRNPLASLFFYSAMLTAGQVLFKFTAQQTKSASGGPVAYAVQLLTTPIFLVACLLYALSTIIWVAILARLPLSQAYPLVIAASILLTTILGITIFKEQLTLDKACGLLLVGIGVKILSRSLA